MYQTIPSLPQCHLHPCHCTSALPASVQPSNHMLTRAQRELEPVSSAESSNQLLLPGYDEDAPPGPGAPSSAQCPRNDTFMTAVDEVRIT